MRARGAEEGEGGAALRRRRQKGSTPGSTDAEIPYVHEPTCTCAFVSCWRSSVHMHTREKKNHGTGEYARENSKTRKKKNKAQRKGGRDKFADERPGHGGRRERVTEKRKEHVHGRARERGEAEVVTLGTHLYSFVRVCVCLVYVRVCIL